MFRVPVQRHAVRAFLYARTSGQFVPKWPAPAADLRRPSVQIDYPPTKNLNGGKHNDNHQSERLLFLVYP